MRKFVLALLVSSAALLLLLAPEVEGRPRKERKRGGRLGDCRSKSSGWLAG